MEEINLNRKSREEARQFLLNLPRNKEFIISYFNNGKKIFITTNGKKSPRDFFIRYEGETHPLKYAEDILLDIKKKAEKLNKEQIDTLLSAIKDSIELLTTEQIHNKHPGIMELDKNSLPGHSIDFLLKILAVLGLQEDVNYWGANCEGRYKPYSALVDLLINKMPLEEVKRKHKLNQ